VSGPYEHNYTMFGESAYTVTAEQLRPITYYGNGAQRLPRSIENTMGFGIHRSGWTQCVESMSSIGGKYVIDDFVEQTFMARNADRYHDTPFIGFFHYPPDDDLPDFLPPDHGIRYDVMFRKSAWIKSRSNLKAVITLSSRLADWLKPKVGVPTFVLKHPTETRVQHWTPATFLQQPRMVQVGAFYRDTRLISRINVDIPQFRILDTRYDWIREWDAAIASHLGPRTLGRNIGHIDRISNNDYDALLSSSVVVSGFLAASASNVVVECIARNTPLVVNRLPAVEEYLGNDYPLYLDALKSKRSSFLDQVLATHKYLKELPKDWLNHAAFTKGIEHCLGSV
jgi:hypothetical protein